MPLNKEHINPASRITLPLYAIVNTGYGWSLLAEPKADLLDVPAYRTLDAILVMEAWGVLFLAVGLTQAVARILGRREAYILTLGLAMVLGGALTVLLFAGAIRDTNPWTAPWFPLCYVGASLATLIQLESRTDG